MMKRAPKRLFDMHQGDARHLEQVLHPYSSGREPLLTCTMTSPPYGDLKNYGHVDQIGWGQSLPDYLMDCREIFEVIYRHTRNEGSLWIVADTLRVLPDNSASRLLPLPFLLADKASEVGWVLKDVVIWKKDKTLPWSHKGRLRKSFEYVLFLTKSEDFKYYIDRLRDPVELEKWWVQYPERYNPQGKVPTNIWDVPIPLQGSWSNTAVQHACPLPPDLIERALLLSTDEGDVVLDPFAGSGAVLAEAERLHRKPIGVELVNDYVEAYRSVVRPEILGRRGPDKLAERMRNGRALQDKILKLRTVKYARVLMKELASTRPDLPSPRVAVALLDEADPSVLRNPFKVIDSTTLFVHRDAHSEIGEDMRRAFKEVAGRSPASKFGIGGDILVVDEVDLLRLVGDRGALFLYPEGRTWLAEGTVTQADLVYLARFSTWRWLPPIVSNIEVTERPRRGLF